MSYTDPHFDTSALIVIDVQSDFTLDGAPAQIDGTLAILPVVASLVDAYREAHLPVAHVVRLYRPDGSNADMCRRAAIESGMQVVAPGSEGSQIADALRSPQMPDLDYQLLLRGEVQYFTDREVAVFKPRWGAFYQTPLHECLAGLGVDTLTFCGCNFPNCPRTSIYEASERDYRIVLAIDAVSRVYEQGLCEIEAIGVQLMEVADIRSALAAGESTNREP
jgi:nicotinamidase-related amidase